MTTADTLLLRDKLIAVLRASPVALATAELAARMPGKVERSNDSCAQLCHRSTLGAGLKVLECHRSWHLVEYRRATHGYTGIYRHLRALEAQGLIRRTVHDDRKGVFWIRSGPDDAAASHDHTGDGGGRP
ncbi:hypothetical protein [Mycobacteroides abscessus]|uniref:hypothetical protein n=1 Tax=Mycobacteroides abscessus TaxID=36809 RepID=UPI0009A805E4|nr:hypothetical protein [Mycobacteroides abscessus]SLJ76217.1 Uncharacterised protein [Mycobacteroides abscessus subsp. abscessus]SLJ80614.1 Uncharacterised protein [Mycobacteroides abscessus subsp. abscessus]